jgi:hypothetical protein
MRPAWRDVADAARPLLDGRRYAGTPQTLELALDHRFLRRRTVGSLVGGAS